MSEWKKISTAPTLDRVFVAGWQKRSGSCAAYWWYCEDCTDEHGAPIENPTALLWQPLPDRPEGTPEDWL